MNENVKTLVFVGAAALLSLAGYVATSSVRTGSDAANAGTGALFPDFKDPLAAARLKIVAVDESTGTPQDFEVANSKGVWSIPSHDEYPADAAKQLEEAAASLIDLSSLSSVSDRRSDHALYGVVDPSGKHESGETGVGKRVTMEDATGAKLCDFIIGKAEPDQPDIRYVRLPEQDRVYRVKINVDKLSTNFADWIEKDLLKIDTFDMRRLLLNHYTVQPTQRGLALGQGEKLQLDYNDKDAKWALLTIVADGEPPAGQAEPAEKEEPLAEGEELQVEKVNELKNSIDQIKIVDVHRKPPGLGRDLRASQGAGGDDQEALQSLVPRGFYPLGDGRMFGAAGEAQIGNATGVKYVLRFGGLDTSSQAAAAKPPAEGEAASPEAKVAEDEANANRFLLVMAEFDPSFIPVPELKVKQLPSLEELMQDKPEPPADAPANGEATEADGEAKPADDAAGEGEKAEEKEAPPTDEPAQPEAEQPKAPAEPQDKALPNGSGPEGEAAQPAAEDKPAAKEPEAGNKPAASDKPADEKPAEGDKPETGDKPEPTPEDEAKRAEEEARKKAAAEQLRNEQDDDRKIADYQRKLKTGREKVNELNDRFADWYYVISDSMYRKILLKRVDLVKMAEPKEEPAEGDAGKPDEPGEDEAIKPAAPARPATPPATTKPATPAPTKPATPAPVTPGPAKPAPATPAPTKPAAPGNPK